MISKCAMDVNGTTCLGHRDGGSLESWVNLGDSCIHKFTLIKIELGDIPHKRVLYYVTNQQQHEY